MYFLGVEIIPYQAIKQYFNKELFKRLNVVGDLDKNAVIESIYNNGFFDSQNNMHIRVRNKLYLIENYKVIAVVNYKGKRIEHPFVRSEIKLEDHLEGEDVNYSSQLSQHKDIEKLTPFLVSMARKHGEAFRIHEAEFFFTKNTCTEIKIKGEKCTSIKMRDGILILQSKKDRITLTPKWHYHVEDSIQVDVLERLDLTGDVRKTLEWIDEVSKRDGERTDGWIYSWRIFFLIKEGKIVKMITPKGEPVYSIHLKGETMTINGKQFPEFRHKVKTIEDLNVGHPCSLLDKEVYQSLKLSTHAREKYYKRISNVVIPENSIVSMIADRIYNEGVVIPGEQAADRRVITTTDFTVVISPTTIITIVNKGENTINNHV